MASGTHQFRAAIEAARGGGAFVTIPFDVEATFGRGRVPVRATIDGEPYRGSLVRMGGPHHLLGILKAIRTKIGKQIGDIVEIVLEEDRSPRVVTVPDDLRVALRSRPAARACFAQLAYSHQREHIRWIEEAKRLHTRRERIRRTIALLEGKSASRDVPG